MPVSVKALILGLAVGFIGTLLSFTIFGFYLEERSGSPGCSSCAVRATRPVKSLSLP